MMDSVQYPCTTAIGFTSCIINLALSVVSYINLLDLNYKSERYETKHVYSEATFRENDELGNHEEKSVNYDLLKRLQLGTLIYSLLMTPISVAMLIGMRKRQQHWVTPWILLSALGIIGMACNVVITGDISHGEPTFSENYDLIENLDFYETLRERQYFTLVYGLVMVVACILLICGVRKRRPMMLLPWLVLAVVGIVIIILLIFFDGFRLSGTQVYSNVLYIIVQSLIWPTVFFIWMELRMDYVPIQKQPRHPENLRSVSPSVTIEPPTPSVTTTKPLYTPVTQNV